MHRPHVGGIHGRSNDGSYSLVLAGGFEDEVVGVLIIIIFNNKKIPPPLYIIISSCLSILVEPSTQQERYLEVREFFSFIQLFISLSLSLSC